MDVNEGAAGIDCLLSGVVAIIDDKVNSEEVDDGDSISTVKRFIEERGAITACFTSIPKESQWFSFGDMSLILIDWQINGNSDELFEKGVNLGEEYHAESIHEVIKFIDWVLSETSVPIIVLSNGPKPEIEGQLDSWFIPKPGNEEDKEELDRKRSLVQVILKEEVCSDASQLTCRLDEWLSNNPSAYVLRKWKNSIDRAVRAVFKRLYSADRNWPSVIWKTLSKDTQYNPSETCRELGELLSGVLINSVDAYDFSSKFFESDSAKEYSGNDVRRVFQEERFIKYEISDQKSSLCHCGDIFLLRQMDLETLGNDFDYAKCYFKSTVSKFSDPSIYLLVISAECDLARCSNPRIAYICGHSLCHLAKRNRRLLKLSGEGAGSKDEPNSILCDGTVFPLDSKGIKDLNKKIDDLTGYPQIVAGGTIVRKQNEIILPCIADQVAISFSLNMDFCYFDSVKDHRIGRLIPPYITLVQQKASAHLVRSGLMPVPNSVFSDLLE